MIKVLVVEDSPVVQALMDHILSSDPSIKVIGIAGDGEQALKLLNTLKPDVITMDIHMPGINGFETTRRIMETRPVPIVIVSAEYKSEDLAMTFKALEVGAVAVVERPGGSGYPDNKEMVEKLIQTIKSVAGVKIRPKNNYKVTDQTSSVDLIKIERMPAVSEIKCIAIGASTGGPQVLKAILSELRGGETLVAPLLIVQHISTGFIQGLIDWLNQTTGFPVHIISGGEHPLPGHAYFAPDGYHMGIDSGGRLFLSKDKPEKGLRPSVSFLFRSVQRVFGAKVIGVLLTGMGEDGAQELKQMREKGAVTIVQDKESSVVHGMPGKAISFGAATYVLSPKNIAAIIKKLAGRSKG